MQGDLFQVDKAPLLEIPIYKSDNQKYLSQLTDFVIHKGKQDSEVSFFERILNVVVFNLYFPDHMKERGIDVLEFVERDINEVMQDNEFEKLSDAEKEQVIEKLHAKWSNPDSEAVKRMEMFKEKSPEILKPILES